jgi:hypothetical protein
LRGINTAYVATYSARGINPELGGDQATVTTRNSSSSSGPQAFKDVSIYGDDEEISTHSGLTSCSRFQAKSWTCYVVATPGMGEFSEFQQHDPPIFISLQVGNFLAILQNQPITPGAAKVVDGRVGGRVATCLSASTTQPNPSHYQSYQVETLHVCLTLSGIPLSFSQSGVETGVDTNFTLTALSQTVVPGDFVPPSHPQPGS